MRILRRGLLENLPTLICVMPLKDALASIAKIGEMLGETRKGDEEATKDPIKDLSDFLNGMKDAG